MRVAFFSTKPFDRRFFDEQSPSFGHRVSYFSERLCEQNVSLADGFPAVCIFVHDIADRTVLEKLSSYNVKLIALRCAGFNNVDLETAQELGIDVVRVPEYSPHAVAEHTIALIMSLNRRLHRAYARVREGNFSLEGLLGFEMFGKTVGIIGTGRIGCMLAKNLSGFGCFLLGYDIVHNQSCVDLGLDYVSLNELLHRSDIISLHCPLVPQTYHMINDEAVSIMKKGCMLINTSRGALIDTKAVINGLKSGRIGYLGLDVYEEEEGLFFTDLSNRIIQDDVLARLLTFPNVIVTGHQGFFTENALENIAKITCENISHFEKGRPLANKIVAERVIRA